MLHIKKPSSSALLLEDWLNLIFFPMRTLSHSWRGVLVFVPKLYGSVSLRYLHEVCLPSVVHRNFKSANILLDEELNPHLSDCGLAALTPNIERQVGTDASISFLHHWDWFLYTFICIKHLKLTLHFTGFYSDGWLIWL